jgi:hypothetical protein
MRSHRRVRWAICALAISIAIPAGADSSRKSVADCAAFSQAEKDEATLELSIHNSCTMPVDCTITWRVVCAPESRTRKAAHAHRDRFTLTTGTGKSTQASALECGDDAFTLDQVQWSCEPNKD